VTQSPDADRDPDLGPEDPAWWTRDPSYAEWMAAHVTDLRRSVSSRRILYWSLAIAIVLGLIAQIAGYAIRASTPAEPVGLATDLLYALGGSLWTGVVVALFVQVIPEAKERQIRRSIAAYEATVRDKRASQLDQASRTEGGNGPKA
jgi:hypothetical protein